MSISPLKKPPDVVVPVLVLSPFPLTSTLFSTALVASLVVVLEVESSMKLSAERSEFRAFICF